MDVPGRFEGDSFLLDGQAFRAEDAWRALYERWYVRGGVVGPHVGASDRALARAFQEALARVRPRVQRSDEWYFVGGGRGGPGRVARVYLHVPREGAARLLEAFRAFDDASIPFRAKVLADPAAFGRVDAAVLYAPRDRIASDAFAALHERIAPWLREGTPPFAKRLARGVAWADDVGGSESFGQERCRLASEGLRAGGVEARFRSAGLDLARPHLAPGADDLTFPTLVDAPAPLWRT